MAKGMIHFLSQEKKFPAPKDADESAPDTTDSEEEYERKKAEER